MKLFFIFLFFISFKTQAQSGSAAMDSSMDMGGMKMDDMQNDKMNMSAMSNTYSLSLPMNRDGSGTSWNPDNSPMYMLMKMQKKSMWMFHGSIFLTYDDQQLTNKTSRSDAKIDAPNWFMTMYDKQVGKNGLFNFTSMISLDALTIGGNGYPLLFQTGESYNGKALVDRQHPHDLFSSLSVAYTQRLNDKVDAFAYFGYPGEPALGPVAFMHRISAMDDPDAPISHHWQDATHITFGVATIGLRYEKLKLEISDFTGREPDANRYDFDPMRFDSYSYRISYNPDEHWALQFSQGYIKSPEALFSAENVWRYTASAIYATPVKNEKYFSASLVWGMNDEGNDNKTNSVLLEVKQQFKKQSIYTRYEFVQKNAQELVLQNFSSNTIFNIHTLTAGTNRKLINFGKIDLLAGLQLTAYLPPPSLQNLYGNLPLAGEIYLQLRPQLSK
jgi:hypothetical protein